MLAPAEQASDPDFAEAGRRLFAGAWDFQAAAGSLEALPAPHGVEVAMAGRSNVGKSSLINALTGRNALARTSHTPGRTQELIFFGSSQPLTVVDMPGYGYAAVSGAKVKAWTRLIHDYLRGRVNLARVFLLVDARHGLKATDLAVLETLDTSAVVYQAVLTKADEVKGPALERTRSELAERLRRRPAAHPDILVTSSRTGFGIEALRAAAAQLLAERGGVSDRS